ncbi:hypothetical protein ACHQM5_008730 [Ranunculus cassubicifolius]
MKLEIPQELEYWPITPIRTSLLARTLASPITPINDENTGVKVFETVQDIKNDSSGNAAEGKTEQEVEDGDSCHTPKSEDQLLKTQVICPPAPRKPRPVKRKSVVLCCQLIFDVPNDLESVFMPLANPSKKIKAA